MFKKYLKEGPGYLHTAVPVTFSIQNLTSRPCPLPSEHADRVAGLVLASLTAWDYVTTYLLLLDPSLSTYSPHM